MATRNTETIIDAKLAATFHAAPKTKQKKALSAFRQALKEAKLYRSEAPRLSKAETELFLRINQTLPEKQDKRLNELNEKIEESVLTDAEQAELLRIAKRVEKIWVDRLQAVVDLAGLRNVSPEEMIRTLELNSPAYAK